MKKILFSLAIVAFAAMTIVSCGGKDDPKMVAKSFLEARNKMDYKTAKKFGTPETGRMLEMLESFSSMVPDSIKNLSKNSTVVIKGEPKIEGDKCTVVATTTIAGESKDENVTLVKIKGKWLVNMSKDDTGAGAENAAIEPETPATDAGTEDATAVPAEEAMPVDDSAKAAH
jgi:hypothetical protein